MRRMSPLFLVMILMAMPTAAWAQGARCDFSEVPGAVWWGTQTEMTLAKLTEYMGPIFWFSPDEPLLDDATGADIRIPSPVPFDEPAESPVVYYRVIRIFHKKGTPSGIVAASSKADHQINLAHANLIQLEFFFYYTRS